MSPPDMKSDQHKELLNNCSLPAALEAVGERWSFLILRGTFNGLHHFEEFQSTLGIARNILSNRLARLVEHDILTREPDPADRRKVAYRLTPKGRALLPVLVALRQWGERWVSGVPSNPVLVDRSSRMPVAPMTVQAADGRPLSLSELDWVDRSEVCGASGSASSPGEDRRTTQAATAGAPVRSEASSSSS
jgi:DNA-binding HxlR family transcriptional regulator